MGEVNGVVQDVVLYGVEKIKVCLRDSHYSPLSFDFICGEQIPVLDRNAHLKGAVAHLSEHLRVHQSAADAEHIRIPLNVRRELHHATV